MHSHDFVSVPEMHTALCEHGVGSESADDGLFHITTHITGHEERTMSSENAQTSAPAADDCYVAVLKRAIPVNDYSTDTSTHVIKDGETVNDVMEWAERRCTAADVMISVEIPKPT